MLTALLLLLVSAAALLAGCGGNGKPAAAPAATTAAPATTGPAPLQPEATAAATGDIPDNQVFVVFTDAAARYSLKVPEGWAQQGSGASVSFRSKNNIVRILVRPGAVPTAAAIRSDLGKVRIQQPPKPVTLPGGRGFKVVYTTTGAANAVTGKQVTLVVDRYVIGHGASHAVVDLGTPVGVDNVDAYKLMITSLRWR
jgi:hypothetical protein